MFVIVIVRQNNDSAVAFYDDDIDKTSKCRYSLLSAKKMCAESQQKGEESERASALFLMDWQPLPILL